MKSVEKRAKPTQLFCSILILALVISSCATSQNSRTVTEVKRQVSYEEIQGQLKSTNLNIPVSSGDIISINTIEPIQIESEVRSYIKIEVLNIDAKGIEGQIYGQTDGEANNVSISMENIRHIAVLNDRTYKQTPASNEQSGFWESRGGAEILALLTMILLSL